MMETISILDLIPPVVVLGFAGVFGSLWGSFANVVIYRWPRELSVLRPASHCFACGRPVRFYDNVPVLAYLWLRGRCRDCGARFSPRYALIELALGLLSVGACQLTLLAMPATPGAGLVAYFVLFGFLFALVTMAFIDLDTWLLPDVITLPGLAVGILGQIYFFFVLGRPLPGAGEPLVINALVDPLVAAAGGFALFYFGFTHGWRLLTGNTGMGEGDAKLIAMIGAFIGLRGVVFTLFMAAFQGLVAGTVLVAMRRRRGEDARPPVDDDEAATAGLPAADDPRLRKMMVPFGPFLALGAIEWVFFGPPLLAGYFDLVERLIGFVL